MFNDEPKKVYQQHIQTDIPEKTTEETITTSPALPEKLKKVQPLKQITSLIVVALIAGASFYLAQRVTTPVPVAEKSSASGLNTVRMLNVYYIPSDSTWVGKSAQIDILSFSTRIYVENASAYHGDPTKQMISFVEPMLPIIRNKKRLAAANSVDVYTDILADTDGGNGKSICQIIQEKSIDQVWLWVDSTVDKAPGSEFLVINSTSNFGALGYSGICPNTRTFTLMGLDYSTPVQNAVHSFGHYLEYLVRWMQGDDLILGRFQGVQNGTNISSETYVYPPYVLSERCGNVHTPPNIPINGNTYAGYQYDMPNTVNSSCGNWNPEGNGTKAPVNSDTWKKIVLPTTPLDEYLNVTDKGGKVQIQYLTWWMQNFNHESANLFYNGKRIPTWWAFVANTDNVINFYINDGNFWMNPNLNAPVAATETASCSGTGGITSNCTYNPGSTVLGAQDTDDSVLGASTYGDMALVSVHFTGNLANPNIKVTSVTYCGEQMTNVKTGKGQIGTPQTGDGMRTDMWYKSLPKAGVCPVVTTFSADPGQRVVSTTIFNNIDTVAPIAGANYAITMSDAIAQPASNSPSNMNMSLSGPKDSLLICGYSLFPSLATPPGNIATPFTSNIGLWKFENTKIGTATASVWGGIGAYRQRTVDNSFDSVMWNTTKTSKWAGLCTNLAVKPFSIIPTTPTPTPTVPPTVPPTIPPTLPPTPQGTVLPTVDLRINGGNINFFDSSLQTLIAQRYTLSWTSTNATGCKINYGDWLGAAVNQQTSGTIALGSKAASDVWQLSCTGPTGTATDVVRVLTMRGTKGSIPIVGLFANNVDTAPYGRDLGTTRSLVIKSGQLVTLTWSAASATSCTASGSWTGAKAVTGGLQQMGAITAAKTYTLTCANGTYKTATSVNVTVK